MDGYVSCKNCKALVRSDALYCPKCKSSMSSSGMSDNALKSIIIGIISVFIAIVIFSIASCSSGSEADERYTPTDEQVGNRLKSMLSGESQIKDMKWDGGSKFLTLGLIDDGTDRSGYAEYVCTTLRSGGFNQNIHIKIIAIDKLAQTKEWVRIGGAECN